MGADPSPSSPRPRSWTPRIPTSRPAPSTTLAAPGRPGVLVITTTASERRAVAWTTGLEVPARITSKTRITLRPIFPPGCRNAYSSLENCRHLRAVIARASETACRAAEEAVGTSPRGQASGMLPTSSTRSESRANGEFPSPVMATTFAPMRRRAGIRRRISSVAPLLDRASTTSPRETRPRSPCIASAGWR